MWGWWPFSLWYSELLLDFLEHGEVAYMCICPWEEGNVIKRNIIREAVNKKIKQPNWESCIANIRVFDGSQRKALINHNKRQKHPSIMSRSGINKREKMYRQLDKTGKTWGKYADLTRRWALRESFPPTEVTLQMYVPMSPDHVWEMCRVPSGSSRRRGEVFTSITEPLFSHTYLEVCSWICEDVVHAYNRGTYTHTHAFTLCISECCDSKSVCLCQFIQQKHRRRWHQWKALWGWWQSDLNLKTISLCHTYSIKPLLHAFLSLSQSNCTHGLHLPQPAYTCTQMHTLWAPVINCDCLGSPANLLCVAFN